MNRPRITLITPTFNRGPYLREALASVVAQNYHSLEHLVIDGGSTDDTKDVVAAFPHVTFLSERDQGMYDAINKGFASAQGECIGLLNSDDLLPLGTLAAVGDAIGDSAIDLVSGEAELFVDSRVDEAQSFGRDVLALSLSNVLRKLGAINARFVRRELRDRVGLFDLRYRIAADREWLLRLALLQPRECWIDRTVYRYRQHDDSMTFDQAGRNQARFRREHLDIAEDQLRRADLPGWARDTIREWHRDQSVWDAQQSLLERSFGAAWKSVRRGCRVNASWPIEFVRSGVRGLRDRANASQPSANNARR